MPRFGGERYESHQGWKLILAATLACQAQVKLATINMNSALAATRDGRKAIAEWNAKRTAKSKEFDREQSEILALQDQLNKGANTLSDSARNALYASIAARRRSVQRAMEDAQSELEADEQKILEQLGAKILAVVQRYAHDNSYTMVVDVGANAGPVLYASAGIDITKEIIAAYDNSAATPAAKPK